VGARDRDAAGRARNARPRDATGRLLEPGEPGVPRVPEGLNLTPGEALAEAERLLAAGLPFQAHEVFEDQWKQRRAADEPDTALWQGLAQLCVGLTHLQRGNRTGAATLLRRGAENLGKFTVGPTGEAVAEVCHWAARAADRVEAGETPDSLPSLRRLYMAV
jgi:hypothetical protein